MLYISKFVSTGISNSFCSHSISNNVFWAKAKANKRANILNLSIHVRHLCCYLIRICLLSKKFVPFYASVEENFIFRHLPWHSVEVISWHLRSTFLCRKFFLSANFEGWFKTRKEEVNRKLEILHLETICDAVNFTFFHRSF